MIGRQYIHNCVTHHILIIILMMICSSPLAYHHQAHPWSDGLVPSPPGGRSIWPVTGCSRSIHIHLPSPLLHFFILHMYAFTLNSYYAYQLVSTFTDVSLQTGQYICVKHSQCNIQRFHQKEDLLKLMVVISLMWLLLSVGFATRVCSLECLDVVTLRAHQWRKKRENVYRVGIPKVSSWWSVCFCTASGTSIVYWIGGRGQIFFFDLIQVIMPASILSLAQQMLLSGSPTAMNQVGWGTRLQMLPL